MNYRAQGGGWKLSSDWGTGLGQVHFQGKRCLLSMVRGTSSYCICTFPQEGSAAEGRECWIWHPFHQPHKFQINYRKLFPIALPHQQGSFFASQASSRHNIGTLQSSVTKTLPAQNRTVHTPKCSTKYIWVHIYIYIWKETIFIQVKLQKIILVDGHPLQHSLKIAENCTIKQTGISSLLLLLLLFWFKKTLTCYGYETGIASSLPSECRLGLLLMNGLFSPPF